MIKVGRWGFLALAALGAVALAGCGGDDDGVTEAASVERYCELSAQLEASAEQHFAQLERGASAEDFRAAHVEFIDQNEAALEEIVEVAPEEVRADTETILAGMRAQAGEEIDVEEAEIDAADERSQQFERESC